MEELQKKIKELLLELNRFKGVPNHPEIFIHLDPHGTIKDMWVIRYPFESKKDCDERGVVMPVTPDANANHIIRYITVNGLMDWCIMMMK